MSGWIQAAMQQNTMNDALSIWGMSKQDTKLMAISDLIYMNKRRSSSNLDKGILISKRWYCSV